MRFLPVLRAPARSYAPSAAKYFDDLQTLNLRFAGVSAARVCIRCCMPRELTKEEVHASYANN